jgi:threonine/homoserine/homoserine lactone efflux protein
VVAQLVAFFGVSAVVIATPGPDTALTIRNSLCGGRRGGVFTAAGVAVGQATWALFTAAGVAAVLRASQPAFFALRIAGVCYLVCLGLQALVSAVRDRALRVPSVGNGRPVRASSAFRQGLLSNLANPKMVVFFISLLPQFSGSASFPTLLLLGLAFCTMTLTWLTAYAVAVAKAGDILRRPRPRRMIDAVTGVALVGLGLRLAVERQQ